MQTGKYQHRQQNHTKDRRTGHPKQRAQVHRADRRRVDRQRAESDGHREAIRVSKKVSCVLVFPEWLAHCGSTRQGFKRSMYEGTGRASGTSGTQSIASATPPIFWEHKVEPVAIRGPIGSGHALMSHLGCARASVGEGDVRATEASNANGLRASAFSTSLTLLASWGG